MGESKRRREAAAERLGPVTGRERALQDVATAIGRELIDQGKLIEAGWAVFADAVLPPGVSEAQKNDMMISFFAGAEHVFSTIINMLEEGEEPTAADLRRMDKIHAEIERWRAVISERVQPSQGRA